MIIIPTNKPHNYYDYTGTPDEITEVPKHKQPLVKDWEIKFNIFSGWKQTPIYKSLNEVIEFVSLVCNKPGIIYHYIPQHTNADKFGMLKYKLIGATKKKSDKRILLIVEDTDPKAIFKHIYLEIVDSKAIDCGHVYKDTFTNWDNCSIGGEYTGHRRTKWIKLDPNNFKELTGKVY